MLCFWRRAQRTDLGGLAHAHPHAKIYVRTAWRAETLTARRCAVRRRLLIEADVGLWHATPLCDAWWGRRRAQRNEVLKHCCNGAWRSAACRTTWLRALLAAFSPLLGGWATDLCAPPHLEESGVDVKEPAAALRAKQADNQSQTIISCGAREPRYQSALFAIALRQ